MDYSRLKSKNFERAVRSFKADVGYHSRLLQTDLEFEGVLVGGVVPLALDYTGEISRELEGYSTSDVDVYTTEEHSDLEKLSRTVPCKHYEQSRYTFRTEPCSYRSASINFDIFTGFEAMGWPEDDAERIENQLNAVLENPDRKVIEGNVTLVTGSPEFYRQLENPVNPREQVKKEITY